MKNTNFHLFYKVIQKFKDSGYGLISLNRVVLSFKIYFSFSFCSDFDLEATVVKTDEIKRLKTIAYPLFSLNWNNSSFHNN